MSDKANNTSRIGKIVDKMLASYAREPRMHRASDDFMPSRPEIVEIVRLCRQVLFPGYFGPAGLTDEMLRYHVGGLLASLDRHMVEQIYRCLCYRQGEELGEEGRSQASQITEQFLGQLSDVRDMLNLDVEAAYDGDPAAKSFDEIIFCYPGFMAVLIYRVAHALLELGVPLMPRIMTEYAHTSTGVDIHPGATVGKRFFIDHATGVVIGETTTIGDNVKIYQGVTLGALSFPKDERGRVIKGLKRHPTLEDNVTVYANATILGGETVIGKGVTVGGNIFVTSSVPADSVVSTKPAELTLRPKRPVVGGQ